MADAGHIVVVDDEAEVREMIAEYLSGHGFRVATAANAEQARLLLQEEAADLALIDIAMPGEDGLSLARHVRETYGCGVIMVTASAGVVDRIVGLEIGADDYIAKPFDPRELLARIRSVLRRLTVAKPKTAPVTRPMVPFGQCLLDTERRRLVSLDGQDIPLTAMEFDLLNAFAERPNRALSRDQLLELAHNRNWDPFDRSIDIRITRLRKKVEPDPTKPQVIRTVRGVGYMYVPSVKS